MLFRSSGRAKKLSSWGSIRIPSPIASPAEPELDRLFLDANILFSAAWRPKSTLLQLWRLKKEGSVELVTSSYAVEEARRNLELAKQQKDLDRLLRQVDISRPAIVPPELPESIRLPEKDRPILLTAISASATHLITGDITHFGSLFGKTVEGVIVMKPGDYLGENFPRA